MIGKVVALILGVVVIGVVVVGFMAIVPSPATCTPDAAVAGTSDARSRWDAWAAKAPPASVTFTEADATAVLREQIQGQGLAIKDPVVHFCGDGTAQLSFTYQLGPVPIKGVAVGSVAATSPRGVTVSSIRIGGLPTAVTDPVVSAVKDVAAQAASLGLAGPVKVVKVSQGTATISQ